MKRNPKFLFIALLAGVFAFGMAACSDDSAGDECNNDGVCDAGENTANCPADCPAPVCNDDGVCDAGESCLLCANDGCCTECDLPNMGGADYDFIVSEMYLPTSALEAGQNGVDIDGDGNIDNRLGSIIALLVSQGFDGDLNASLNQEIIDGSLLLATRVRENDPTDGDVAVQIFQAEIFDSTPLLMGDDDVLIAADTPQDLFLCGQWDGGPELQTDPSDVTIAFPLPSIGLLEVTLTAAQIRTVTDSDSEFFGDSEVTANGMSNVMIGGGLSRDEIYGPGGLIEFLGGFIQGMIDEGGSTADTILNLFDGNCVAMDDIPGCETIVAEEGTCLKDDIIHVDELKCSALLSSALAPDVDIDGDGENDLVSLGLRIVSAVPVTLHFE